MVQALKIKGNEKVLELGTGSGYEAAILGELAKKVVTLEIVPELAEGAKKVLERLSYSDVEVHVVGGPLGWPEGAPYDAIIVSAGAPCTSSSLGAISLAGTIGNSRRFPLAARTNEGYQIQEREQDRKFGRLFFCTSHW